MHYSTAEERTVIVSESRIVNILASREFDRGEPAIVTRISLVIPAYNESSRLPHTLDAAWSFLESRGDGFELILVDDGSTDDTSDIARRFAAEHSNVTVITIRHAGKAAAVRAGLEAATGNIIGFSDADLATPLGYLDDFIARVDGGVDIVIGSREGVGARRIGEPWYRHAMGRVFNRMVQLIVLSGIEDTQCGFKVFRREAAQSILDRTLLYRDGRQVSGPRVTAFDVEFLAVARALGLTIVSVPVVWTYGTNSKVNPIRDTLHNAYDILRVRANLALGRYKP
jgi:glycosyltransferase involved in cell wall biosynthesis